MKRIAPGLLLAALAFLLSPMLAAASVDDLPYRSIRGAVYQDVNGDGRCVDTGQPGELPVAGVTVSFSSGGESFSLQTGSNGTYGLASVALGLWQVSAQPDPAEWTVTSANPLSVSISPSDGFVQSDVNFCVGGAAAGPAVTQEAVDPMVAAFRELAARSKALLVSPPEPEPPEDVAAVAEQPVEEKAPPVADWLGYVNLFREMGALTPFVDSEALTRGSQLHSRYMVVNDRPIAHSEDPGNPLYDPDGHLAAKNGNIFATSQVQADYVWSTNFWISAPFHLVPMLDPGLESVGYGAYNEEVGTFHMAAVMDVRTELGDPPGPVDYPLYFPGDGAETWVVRHNLYEWPDPITSCPGYGRPTGAPLVLQLGDGSLIPNVTSHALYVGDRLLESCHFDETSYTNPDGYAQGVGRIILDQRDAIVILPKNPLAVGQEYRVVVEANGQSYTWQFQTRSGPP